MFCKIRSVVCTALTNNYFSIFSSLFDFSVSTTIGLQIIHHHYRPHPPILIIRPRTHNRLGINNTRTNHSHRLPVTAEEYTIRTIIRHRQARISRHSRHRRFLRRWRPTNGITTNRAWYRALGIQQVACHTLVALLETLQINDKTQCLQVTISISSLTT